MHVSQGLVLQLAFGYIKNWQTAVGEIDFSYEKKKSLYKCFIVRNVHPKSVIAFSYVRKSSHSENSKIVWLFNGTV
jgi:hypothetical protein